MPRLLGVALAAWVAAWASEAGAAPADAELAPSVAGARAKQGKSAAPELDLTSLEQRLKDTEAIGAFTKLTLKNQVDDLLERFRYYYAGRVNTTLTELRQPYDLLILKVLALLQDRDPELARHIRDSREAIWNILSDKAKFTKLAT